MSRAKNNQNNGVPQWQSNKMRTMIVERWQEVWEVVEERDKKQNYSD